MFALHDTNAPPNNQLPDLGMRGLLENLERRAEEASRGSHQRLADVRARARGHERGTRSLGTQPARRATSGAIRARRNTLEAVRRVGSTRRRFSAALRGTRDSPYVPGSRRAATRRARRLTDVDIRATQRGTAHTRRTTPRRTRCRRLYRGPSRRQWARSSEMEPPEESAARRHVA